MPVNEGPVDRIARAALAILALVAGILIGPGGVWSVVFYVVAAILALTAAIGMCPLYRLVGMSTLKKN